MKSRTDPTRILLEGRPGVGKTTVARRLVQLLKHRGLRVGGFTTEEIRSGRRRVGFAIESMSGERAVLARIDVPGPPRVGKYGVDLAALERVALPALDPSKGSIVVVDEIGKMEIASLRVQDSLTRLFESGRPIVATVHVFRHAFTDGLKARDDVEVLRVTEANRDALPGEVADRIAQ